MTKQTKWLSAKDLSHARPKTLGADRILLHGHYRMAITIVGLLVLGHLSLAQDLTVSGMIPVGSSPQQAVITPNGGEVYVSNNAGNTISVISTSSNSVVSTIPVGTRPTSLAISPDGSRVYVANSGDGLGENAGGSVSVINTATKSLVGSFTFALPGSKGYPVRDIALTPNGAKLYVALEYGGLARIFTATNTGGSISGDLCPEGVSVSPDGTRLYVTYQCSGPGGTPGHDAIGVFDVASDNFLTSITGLPNVGGSAPKFTPNGAQFWENGTDVCSQSFYDHIGCPPNPGIPESVVNIVQASSNTLLQSLGLPISEGAGSTVSFFPDSTRALIGGNTLKIVDTASFATIAAVPISASGSVVFAPTGTRAYAPVPSQNAVAVLLVTAARTDPPKLGVDNNALSFISKSASGRSSAQLRITNRGGGTLTFATSSSTVSGGPWLSVSPATGTVTASAPVTVTVTADLFGLSSGTYSGKITVSSATTGERIDISVTLAIGAAQQSILLSQTGLTFTAVAGGGGVPSQSFGVLNIGQGVMAWTASSSTISGGPWLSVTPTSGSTDAASLNVPLVDVSVNAAGLSRGAYYGQIKVTAPGADNSPQIISVFLNVLPPGSNPGAIVRPSGLIFTGVEGGSSDPQNVLVSNVTANPVRYVSSGLTFDGETWFSVAPAAEVVFPSRQIVVQPDLRGLAPGIRRGVLTLLFEDGTTRTVNLLLLIDPAAGSARSTDVRPELTRATDNGCVPKTLLPEFVQAGLGSTVTVGYPALVEVKVVDDCGSPMTSGSVVTSFSNGDPALSLTSLRNGTWASTWQPNHAITSVTLSAVASLPELNLTGTAKSLITDLQLSGQNPPTLSTGPIGLGSPAEGPFAPGDVMLIRGSGLADGIASSDSVPLQQQLAGSSVVVGGKTESLLYADPGQVIGLAPLDLPVNTSQQLIVLRDNALGIPVPVIIAATHPVILTKGASGQGQGMVYKANGAATTLADEANPVKAGDAIIIYCTGLGAIDTSGKVTNYPTVSIDGQPAPVSYAGVALPEDYPPDGAPELFGLVSGSLGGLYQISTTVPGGLDNGLVSVSISSAGQSSQTGVVMTIDGTVAPSIPVIASVNTAGGFPDIAQNTFIEIRGSDLAPASVGVNGMNWNSAPDFASGRMPTALGGVSVTVNGRPAFVNFISARQINVLTPLDDTTGPVQLVVENNGNSSAPLTAVMRSAAPSFLLFGGTKYIVATHSDSRLLVGPASLSVPGYPFLPAAPAETIVLYGVGFALPKSPVVNGSSTQSGELPANPLIQIGGVQADIKFAGVVSPGLYQLNVTVPSTATNGDNAVTCNYEGQSAPTGALLNIQRQ
jgi:uncharacterized protein (TIGR03437 family)